MHSGPVGSRWTDGVRLMIDSRYEALGLEKPLFAHLPLLINTDRRPRHSRSPAPAPFPSVLPTPP